MKKRIIVGIGVFAFIIAIVATLWNFYESRESLITNGEHLVEHDRKNDPILQEMIRAHKNAVEKNAHS